MKNCFEKKFLGRLTLKSPLGIIQKEGEERVEGKNDEMWKMRSILTACGESVVGLARWWNGGLGRLLGAQVFEVDDLKADVVYFASD